MPTTRGCCASLRDLLGVMLGKLFRLVRVNAHGGVNPIVAIGQGDRRLKVIRPRAAPDGQEIAQPGGAGTRHHLRAVGVEIGIVEMSVRIQ